jgi:hypothetical protein
MMRFSDHAIWIPPSHLLDLWSDWEPYATEKSWTFSNATNGSKYIKVQYRDGAGNDSAVVLDTIILDTAAPGGGVAINGSPGSQPGYTISPDVAVTVTPIGTDLSGLKYVYLSNIGGAINNFQQFAYDGNPINWNLNTGYLATPTDGQRAVRYMFEDKAGNRGGVVLSGAVTLDTRAPTGRVKINNGAAYTKTMDVTLNLSATDTLSGVGAMRFSNAADFGTATWVTPFAASVPWTLAAGDGGKTAYAQFRDKAGNISTGTISDSIILDATPPQDGTLTAVPGNKQVALSWSGFSDAGSGLQSYQLYYSATAIPTPATGAKVYQGKALSFVHPGLTNGAACYYRLCAVDKVGNVSVGATASATPKVAVLPFLELLLLDD